MAMEAREGARGESIALAVLLLAYIFNFVDRQIIGVLAIPIKAELGLSDTQLSLMGGLAFAIFYSSIAVPVAWLADRTNRVTIIAGAVALWSLFTALCGLAQNFWQLFLARMGVGIGEAGGVAPCYALIADSFPRERRARALAIFSLGIPLGSALGLFFGGWLAAHLDWRLAFVIVGLAGLPVALLVRLLVKEKVRGAFDGPAVAVASKARFAETVRTMTRKPSFWLLSLGAACGSIMGYGLIFWLPSFFNRSHGLALADVGVFYGSIVLVGGVIGTLAGGWLADKAGAGRPGIHALIPAICFAISVPVYAAGLFTPSIVAGWLLFTLAQALGLAWLGPVISAVQHIVPPAMRATTSASFLFINNLVGIAFGIFFLGFMSDRMTAAYGAEALRYSMLAGLGFTALSSLLYFAAFLRLERDWHPSG